MVSENTSSKKKVDVLLMGERFSVRSDQDEKHIENLSRIVNSHLLEIKRNARSFSAHHVALLTALNLADELSKTKLALERAEGELLSERSKNQEMKCNLAEQAKATLQEIETALSYLPAELRSKEEQKEESVPSARSFAPDWSED